MDGGTLAAWVGIGVTVALAIFGFILRTYKEKIDEAKATASKAREELSEYKLVVAEKYASIPYLKDVESRILTAITDMSKRLDRLVAAEHREGGEGR
jgi:MFS superfamily sulfate permease-like transporter